MIVKVLKGSNDESVIYLIENSVQNYGITIIPYSYNKLVVTLEDREFENCNYNKIKDKFIRNIIKLIISEKRIRNYLFDQGIFLVHVGRKKVIFTGDQDNEYVFKKDFNIIQSQLNILCGAIAIGVLDRINQIKGDNND